MDDRSTHDLFKIDALQAILFASAEALPLDKIAEILELKDAQAHVFIQELKERLAAVGGIALVESPDGFRLVTKPEFGAYIERLREPQKIRLSKAALETLAIVAYRQPVTRAEIDQIRGVDSTATLQTLIDRALVDQLGRKEAPGRPVLYGTTSDFLEHFGMAHLSELPELPESQIEDQASDVGTPLYGARDLFERAQNLVAESLEEAHSPNGAGSEDHADRQKSDTETLLLVDVPQQSPAGANGSGVQCRDAPISGEG